MKKPFFILFLIIFLISISVGYALQFGISESSGEQGGFIIAEFKEKEFSFGDVFQQEAIIPTYVNAGSIIEFKGELAKVIDFTGFLFGVPDKIIIRIYEFDSTKSNFLGEQINSFTITIPESARQSLSNPLTTIIIFDATMTVPTQIGKYRYEAEPRFGNYREASIQLDYDTFNVQQGVPEICTLPSTETTFQDIPNGQLKIITLTSYVGLSCTKSVSKTYNTICNIGYRIIGSGASGGCEIMQICGNAQKESGEECDDGNTINGDGCSSVCKNEDTPTPTGCPSNQVCCEYDVYKTVGGVNQITRTTECLLPSDCKMFDWDKPNGKAVANQQCGGSTGSTIVQICGDKTIQSPETCDDGNTANGDGCSNICKVEGVVPSAKQLPITEDELDILTPKAILASACDFGSDCGTKEGYTVKCESTDDIKAKVKKAFNEEKSWWCTAGAEDISIGGVVKLVGYVLGTGYWCKTQEPPLGVCLATTEGGTDFGNIGNKVADALGIKGENKGTWGWVILIIGFFVIMAIISKIGK